MKVSFSPISSRSITVDGIVRSSKVLYHDDSLAESICWTERVGKRGGSGRVCIGIGIILGPQWFVMLVGGRIDRGLEE